MCRTTPHRVQSLQSTLLRLLHLDRSKYLYHDLVYECVTLVGLRANHTHLLEGCCQNMRAFFAQHHCLRVFKIDYVIDCLDLMDM